MSTSWSITASDMIRGALELNGAIDPTEAVSAEDSALCLRELQAIIKELPLHGLSWPKLSSTAVAVTWSIGTPNKVSPPSDYFGVPVLKYTGADTKLHQLVQIPRVKWEQLDQTITAPYPELFYEAPDRSLYLYPAPTQDPLLKLTYQAIADDATLTAAIDVQQAYLGLFELWIADRISLKFETPAATRAEIKTRMKEARELMKQWAIDKAPISFSVDNYTWGSGDSGRGWTPWN
jgi:hypothetical protein